MAAELLTEVSVVGDGDHCRHRKASIDSTNASGPPSHCSGSSDDSSCIPTTPEEDPYDVNENFDVANASLDAASLQTVIPGMSIRVWRRTETSPRMEWVEVIQATKDAQTEEQRFLCETLLFELFEFSPNRVEQGCDDVVEAFEIPYEDAQKASWRNKEVARLQSALEEKAGRLVQLPSLTPLRIPGVYAAESQFCIKATITSNLPPEQRQELQESIQKRLLQEATAHPSSPVCCRQLCDAASATSRAQEDQRPLRRWWQNMRKQLWPHQRSRDASVMHVQTAPKKVMNDMDAETNFDVQEALDRHIPELCSECIGAGTWCSGSLHLAGAAASLDAAVERMYPSASWSIFEGGVETVVAHEDVRLLLQIRPRLFFIPDTDAKLFG